MSISTTPGFKKQKCTDMHQLGQTTLLKDVGSGIVDFQIVGTDTNVGVVIGNDIVDEYSPPADADGYPNTNPDGTFLICIETSGAVYHVRLFDGNEFVITAVQSAAYLGQWYPAKIQAVLTGTTGDFSVGY